MPIRSSGRRSAWSATADDGLSNQGSAMNTMLKHLFAIAGLIGAAVLGAASAGAVDLIVVDAKGVSLQPRPSVDGAHVLKLAARQPGTPIGPHGKNLQLSRS